MNASRWLLSAAVGAAAALAACSDDLTNIGVGSGYLTVEVATDLTVKPGGDITVPSLGLIAPPSADYRIYLTDAAGNNALWISENTDGSRQFLLPGSYGLTAISGTAGAEGFMTPCYEARTDVAIENGATTAVNVTASLSNALVDLRFDSSLLDVAPECHATVHSRSGHYLRYSPADSGPLFVNPGDISVDLAMTLTDGRKASFEIISLQGARAATYYSIDLTAAVDGSTPVVTASASTGAAKSVALTEEFLSTPAPAVTASGFTPGEPVTISEGGIPAEPLKATIESADLSALYFTAIAPTLGSAFTREVNLLDLSPSEKDSLQLFGLGVSGLDRGPVNATIDFSRLVGHLRYVANAIPSSFSILAVDAAGHVSEPLTLSVDVRPVEIELIKVSKAIIGVNKAQMTVASTSGHLEGNLVIEAFDSDTRTWRQLAIESIAEGSLPSQWVVTFEVPDGLDPVNTRLLFCDKEISVFTIRRSAPSYTLSVDPFALHAVVSVEADDSTMTGVVTSSLQFYTGSGERIILLDRNPAKGEIVIYELRDKTSYLLRSSLIPNPGPADFGPAISFRTEAAAQLPNADFEDVEFKSIVYNDMPSGGRYSQNTVEIYNRQNHTSFDIRVPEKWANVNAKTFCTSATNHNTWYLAPSTYSVTDAYSGAYAVRMDCVGYDLHGPAIADYLQTSLPYTDYSLNIPSGYSRAAGRLFLGTYDFDADNLIETYDEGITFGSRPTALNGFYKFTATSANTRASALARIEVVGETEGMEILIASGERRLPPASSYSAFSIPLTYNRAGIKARSLRIIFAPTDAIGTIDSETAQVIVMPFPSTATLRGSSLWIDNLSLSY